MERMEKAVKELARAARTVAPEQGDRARRNARQRVLNALRRVREVLDADYPVARRSRKGPARENRWEVRTIVSGTWAEKFAAAGIRLTYVDGLTHAPTWAWDLRDASITDLQRARKSVSFRKVQLARVQLATMEEV